MDYFVAAVAAGEVFVEVAAHFAGDVSLGLVRVKIVRRTWVGKGQEVDIYRGGEFVLCSCERLCLRTIGFLGHSRFRYTTILK